MGMTGIHQPRITTLDGLRGLACLLVYIRHASTAGLYPDKPYSAAALGLMLFFTLSGFLMAHHYLPGEKSVRYWGAFLIRRFFRLYPAFMFVTFAYFVAFQLDWPVPRYRLTFDRVLENWFLQRPAPTFWTVHLEVKFYTVFVLGSVVLLLLPLSERMKALLFAVAWLALAAIVVRVNRYDFLPYLPYFMGGALAGYITQMELVPKAIPSYIWSTLLLLLTAIIYYMPVGIFLRFNPVWFSAPLMFLIVLALVHVKGWIAWLFSNPVAHFMGQISFSFYLLHYGLLYAFKPQTYFSPEAAYFAVFILIFCASCLLYWLIERPGMRLGKTLAGKLWSPRHTTSA